MSYDKKQAPEGLPPGFKAYGVINRPTLPDVGPDWSEWRYTPKVEVWQACALSLNFDPHSLKKRDEYMSESGAEPYFEDRSFPSVAIREEFNKRRRMVIANLPSNSAFSFPSIVAYGFSKVALAEFAAWARNIGWDIPPELVALAPKPVEQPLAPQPPKCALVAPVKVGAGKTAIQDKVEPSMRPGSNAKSECIAWIMWAARKLKKADDTIYRSKVTGDEGLVARILSLANEPGRGYLCDGRKLKIEFVRKNLPKESTGGLRKNGSKQVAKK